MTAKKHKATMQLYAQLMEEVKVRQEAMKTAIQNRSRLPAALAKEFCWLQLRMTAELVALACVVAHGDIEGVNSPDIRNEWSAARLSDRIEELHADYYPQPMRQSLIAPGKFSFEPVRDGYLTKDCLAKLVGRCGDALHRGKVRRLVPIDFAQPVSFSDISAYVTQITNLLRVHRIVLVEPGNNYFCLMRTDLTAGAVQMVHATVPADSWGC